MTYIKSEARLRCDWCGQFWHVPLDDHLLCYLTDDNINTTMKECIKDLMLAEGGKYGTPVDCDEHMCQDCTNKMDDEHIHFELLHGREPDAGEEQALTQKVLGKKPDQ
jgi:hypothetical protein